MTISFGSAPAHSGSTSAGSSLSLTTNSINLYAGNLLLFVVATDNVSTSAGATNTHTSFAAEGWTITKIAEHTSTAGVAGDGVTTSLWITQLESSHSGTISFTASFSASLANAKMQMLPMTVGGTVTVDGVTAGYVRAASDPGSLALSGLANAGRMYVRVIGRENPPLSNITPTDGWTAVNLTGRVGGSSDGVAVRAEYLSSTGTGATSNPTWTSADSSSILIALNDGAGGSSETITITPDPTTINVGATREFTITRGTAASGDITYDLESSDTGKATVPATATLLDTETVCTFNATGVAAGSATITATNAADSNESDSITVDVVLTRKLRVLVEAAAAGAAGVSGAVWEAPSSGKIKGAEIGEFSGASFNETLAGGKAELKVPVADFGGEDLSTSDVPAVLVRTDTYTTGITTLDVSIIEE